MSETLYDFSCATCWGHDSNGLPVTAKIMHPHEQTAWRAERHDYAFHHGEKHTKVVRADGSMCRECSFESENGHAPDCSKTVA